jgi:hypothetical protein
MTADPDVAASPDATYRELVDAAFSAVGKASFEMMRTRFADQQQAGAAVAAYRDLLDGVRAHMAYFAPTTRQTGTAEAAPATPLDDGAPLAAAAVLLAQRAHRSPAPADTTSLPAPALLWRTASAKLRAAHDLLDTHRDPDFGWRTPDAWLLDHSRPQAAALAGLAGFLRTVAHAGQALALRARETDRDIECADLLHPEPLRVVAGSLNHHARAAGPLDALDELTPARVVEQPASGDEQPLGIAVRAMAVLRQRAWEQARAPHVSIRTIGHYAQLAVTVHHHTGALAAAAAARHAPASPRDDATTNRLRRAASASYAAATAWRQVYQLTTALHTPAQGEERTYERILDVRADFKAVARDGATWRRPDELFPDAITARNLLASAHRIVRPLEEISAWQGAAVGRLANGDSLYVPAAALDRDEVSDDPRLVAARLARRLVILPPPRVRELRQACVTADRATWTAVKATAALTSTPGPASRPKLLVMRALHRAAGYPAAGL